jgi:hypothetical protein
MTIRLQELSAPGSPTPSDTRIEPQSGLGSDKYMSCWVAVGLCGDIRAKRVPTSHVALRFRRTNRQAVYKFHFPPVCGDCGLPVIARCDSCHEGIFANKSGETLLVSKFCLGCFRPYPWSSPEHLLIKLRELLELDNLDEAVRGTVSDRVDQLVAEANRDQHPGHVRLSVRIKTIGQRLWKDAGLPAAQSVLTEACRRLLRMA